MEHGSSKDASGVVVYILTERPFVVSLVLMPSAAGLTISFASGRLLTGQTIVNRSEVIL